MKKSIICLIFASFVVLTACKKEETAAPAKSLEPLTVKNLAAAPVQIDPNTGKPIGGTNKFTLYSLKDNAIIANTDSATEKWDIGFRGTTLIVNGGKIRAGKGGAYIHTGLFDELKSVPDRAEWRTDESETDLGVPLGSGKGWYNYDHTNNRVSPVPGKILLIRTAQGKYAKLEILSYYKNAPAVPSASDESRYFTFKFVYQADGSKNF